MYAAVDPIYMVMLIHNLGDDVRVWDKAARIRFLQPGRETLFARFVLGEDELEAIRSALDGAPKVDRTYRVELVDAGGEPHAEVEKVVHVRRPEPGRPP